MCHKATQGLTCKFFNRLFVRTSCVKPGMDSARKGQHMHQDMHLQDRNGARSPERICLFSPTFQVPPDARDAVVIQQEHLQPGQL